MQLNLPDDCTKLLRQALRKAGPREIGGQIFGEQLAPSCFSATELTIQRQMGSFARFVVDLVQAARDALKFFDRTNHSYTRFNYIGEWHSHPSFELIPSGTDIESMKELVVDAAFEGNFAVLMIVKLEDQRLCARGWVFDRTGASQEISLGYLA